MSNTAGSMRRYVAIDEKSRDLTVERDAVPTPKANELLIKVHCAGLNRADMLQRMGLYPPPADASPIMGLEVAGEVLAVGAHVKGWQQGDKVCALTHGGGYADHAVAPEGQCMPIPPGMTMAEAAALPEALLTVWHNVFQRAALKDDEKVLIHGGASGIGTMGIMMCKAMGHQVYTTAGSDEKCQALVALGATQAVNYKTEDFEIAFTEAGLKDKLNVILDMAGGDFVQKNINMAAPEGRIVYIAFIRGFTAEVNFANLLMKRLSVTGSTLRAQSFAQKEIMTQEILEHVYPHLNNGAIKPFVDRVFLLDDVADAHTYMQSGVHMGKIVLQM